MVNDLHAGTHPLKRGYLALKMFCLNETLKAVVFVFVLTLVTFPYPVIDSVLSTLNPCFEFPIDSVQLL